MELADGRILDGRFIRLPGVAIDPLEAAQQGTPRGESIRMCDDELARTMVSKRQVRSIEEAVVDPGMERIRIPQRVPDGGRLVAGVGAILGVTPFDEYGRRVLTLATAAGRVEVVQGITEITPHVSMSAAAAAGTGSVCVSKRCLSLSPCAQKGSGTFS